MKTTISTIALALFAGQASAEAVTIATGKPGGGYDRRAQEIAQRLEQRGQAVEVVNLNGSDEISLAVCGGRAGLGLMQIDAIYARAMDMGCDLKPVGVYGTEYAMLLIPPGADKDELDDFGAGDAILADTIGSGSDLWLRTAIGIETGEDGDGDEWAKVRIVNDPLELAHASASMGEINAVLLVRKPNSPDVIRLLDLGWTLGYLWDRDLDDLTFKGQPLYAGEKIAISVSSGKQKNWAYQVRSFIVASQKIATGDRKVFAAITAAVGQ